MEQGLETLYINIHKYGIIITEMSELLKGGLSMEKLTRAEAQEKMQSGLHCSQVVIEHCADQLGLDKETVMKLAAGLGGGCKHGEICGAITGGILALGYKYGFTDGPTEKENTVLPAKVNELENHIIDNHGTLYCRDFLGFDKGKPEGPDNMPRDDMFEVCFGLCEEVCAKMDELLK